MTSRSELQPRLVTGYASNDDEAEAPPADLVPSEPRKKGAPLPRLTIDQVRQIRAEYAAWKHAKAKWLRYDQEHGRASLAARYGITERYLNRVLCYDVWTDDGFKRAGGRATPLRGICKWAEMSIGDSHFFACRPEDRQLFASRFYRAAWQWSRRNGRPMKVSVRTAAGGVLIRRVA